MDGVTVAMLAMAAALPVISWQGLRGKPPGWCRRWHLVVTVRGCAGSVESRLLAGCCAARVVAADDDYDRAVRVGPPVDDRLAAAK